MSDNLKLCMGCMNPLGEDHRCRVCGYVEGTPYLPIYLAPRTVINNRYIVGRLISYNGEGATYIGYDRVINKKVDIREFFPDTLCIRVKGSPLVSINPNKLVQFKNLMSEFVDLYRSISKMRTLTHINAVYEVFAENNTAYAILEHLEGITLKQYLQEKAGELSWMEIKQLFPPLFTTLNLIHNASIVHKGLSLDTIYYTNRNELMITGFCTSAARSTGSDLAPEFFPGFVAPEQYRPNSWLGTWTDVYALSAILYRCLTGCMPANAISRIGNDNMLEPYAINPVTPQHVSKIIMEGLRLDNEVRIQTVTELVTRLFEVPDFSERRKEHTSTVIIPKQSQQKRPVQNYNEENLQGGTSGTKVYLYVLGGLVAAFIIVVLVLLIIFGNKNENDDGNNDNNVNNTSISSSESVEDSQNDDVSEDEDSQVSSQEESKPAVLVINIPNFVSRIYDEVESQYGKRLTITPEFEYNEDYEDGIIFDQSIEHDTKVEEGSELTLKVSKGSKMVIVPQFNNKSVREYKEELDRLGIKYEFYPNNENIDNWHISNTSPQPDEKFDKTLDTLYIQAQK